MVKNTLNNERIVIFLGVALVTIGTLLLSSNYFNEKADYAYSYMNNLLLDQNEEIYEMDEEVDNLEEATSSFQEEETEVQEEPKKYVDPYLNYYTGYIEIPKINLSKGFTKLGSPYNTVNKNVEIVKGSTYPDKEKGNFILAAHSGTSYLAYFKNLYKLKLGDVAYIKYNGKRYTYKIVNIYEQQKTGRIAIYRDTNKTCLTLVTCTKDVKDKQTIYILELEDIKNI